MSTDILKGQWKQLRGAVKRQWGKLTDDELDKVSGSFDQLAGLLQERYGYSRAEAGRHIDELVQSQNVTASTMREGMHEARQGLERTGDEVMSRARETGRELESAGHDLERTGDRVLSQARDTLGSAGEDLQHAGQRTVSTVKRTVSDRPIMSMGAALGLGAVLGVALTALVNSSRSDRC